MPSCNLYCAVFVLIAPNIKDPLSTHTLIDKMVKKRARYVLSFYGLEANLLLLFHINQGGPFSLLASKAKKSLRLVKCRVAVTIILLHTLLITNLCSIITHLKFQQSWKNFALSNSFCTCQQKTDQISCFMKDIFY